MHQSFATTSPRGLGNSGDIDFSICKAQVKFLHCRNSYYLLQSHIDKKKKSQNLVTFFCSPQNFSIRSVATAKLNMTAVIFLPALPASQTHDSHKGRMILNHESPAGRIKNCGEKSAFRICNFRFDIFLLAHRVLNDIGKNWYRKTPQQYSDHYYPWETHVFSFEPLYGEFTGKSQYWTTGKSQCR